MNAPRQLRITSPFGMRADPYNPQRQQFHNGIDIAVPEGTIIQSPLTGVAVASWHDAGGHQVIVDGVVNGQHWRVGFAHLKEPGRSGPVEAGHHLGATGNSGARSKGPHVHITTRLNGQWVDPLTVLDLSGFELVRG